ncbi:hypothetical protein Cgig2_003384 [Carnegiea gigantea]|uniref:Reverse transcriptase domain-containing protein n=1 Tax=Carnegiea gigantea TaxID=171969 RepID=A0A9Q1GNB0_9CARY|nr:hypothetical protein Cgig2_003384 [Carnegiea gigantea]
MTDAITRQVSEQVKRVMKAANSARPLPHFNYIPTHVVEPSHRLERVPSPRYSERERAVSRLNRSVWPYTEQLGRRVAARPSGRPMQGTTVRGHPMLRRLPPMIAPLKSKNARKYCEFHKQSEHTTTECRELKKALHELADKGQIDRFLKRGPRFLRREQEPAQPQSRDEECSMEVVATIAGGYTEGMTRSAWKAQLRSAQQVLTTK